MTKTDATDIDQATREAIAALTSRVRNRDAADEREDAELFAMEFLAAMRGQGWRPTPARPAQPWHQQIAPPLDPEVAHRGAALARQALADAEEDA